MSHFPLNAAALCQDCSQIGDSLKCCACCGSRSLMSLAPLLNREPSAQHLEPIPLRLSVGTDREEWAWRKPMTACQPHRRRFR